MIDKELVKETQELLGDVIGVSPKVQVQVLTVVLDTVAYLIEQVKSDLESEHTRGIIEELVRDLGDLTKKLSGLPIERQVEKLNIIAATAKWVADHLNADLALERRLKEVGK